jgi:hypothetical protein
MKKLYCHTTLDMVGGIAVKEDCSYEICCESNDSYEIINEMGFSHIFSKEPDDDGYSFATWFSLDHKKRNKVYDFTRINFYYGNEDGDCSGDPYSVLVNNNDNTGNYILAGDYYHDKIDELIDGFFIGLEYTGVEANLDVVEVATENIPY